MNHRHKILLNYAAWTATAALRSGKHIKDGDSLQKALGAVVHQNDIPSTQAAFDEWHERIVLLLQKKVLELRAEDDPGEFSIGWSAKLLNIYLKTLFYVGDMGPDGIRKVLHPPIDNILVDSIIEEYGVSIWTPEEKFTIQGLDHYNKYAAMIDRIKLIALEANLENLIDIEHVWTSTSKKSTDNKKYKLHEAMVDALKSMPLHQGSFEEVAKYINDKGTYLRKDGDPVPAFQIKLRAFLSKGKYSHMFKRVGHDSLQLVH